MNKLRHFVRSDLALQDLKEIAQYGRKYFAPETNHKFKIGLTHIFKLLCQPDVFIGTPRDEIKAGLLMFPYQRYNIYFYRTNRHSRQNGC